MSERGLVVAPHFTFDGQTLAFPGLVGLDPASLRYYLLYWDRLEWPDNNIISIGSSPDNQFLIDAGILSRSQVTVAGFSGNAGYAYIAAQIAAFRTLSVAQPGQWALGQTAARLFVPPEDSQILRVIEIELYRALPAPPEGLALADVLEFKARRAPELKALRAAMDDLYMKVTGSPDIPRAQDAAIVQLDSALKDLQAAANASWGERLLSSLKVEVKLPDVALTAAAGGGLAIQLGLPAPLGMAAGAIAATLKFEAQALRAPQLPERLSAFAYLYHAHRDLK